MTDKLPPNLLALFQPRPPLRYIPPQDSAPEERGQKKSQLSGLAAFLPQFDDYKENDDYEPTESWLQKRDQKRHEKKLQQDAVESSDFQGYKPDEDPKIKGDAVKTLFVGRLSYDAKEADLEREFGRFGPIERIRIIKDESTSKPKKPHKGYAFIVYEREKDMRGNFVPCSPTRAPAPPLLPSAHPHW
jgi:U1 small nuclear ribonucleoprotein 70kDa